MNKQDVTLKLAAVEASLKRWQTRLLRATNMVTKLDRQRRRHQLLLLNPDQPVIATVKVRVPVETDHLSEAEFATFAKQKQRTENCTFSRPQESTVAVAEDIGIPAFLDRSNPVIAAEVEKARKKAERLAEARKAMPLSGKAALAKIRQKK